MIVAKEFNPELGEEDNTALQDFDDNDDTDETISFCDLPLNGANTSDGDVQDQKSSFDDHDQDIFEFFSEDLSSGIASSHSTDSIIFCGKLIPCNKEEEKKQQSLEITAKPKHTMKSSSVVPSKLSRHVNKSSTNNNTSSESKQERRNKTCRSPVRAQENNIANDKNEYSSMRKLSNLSILSMKSAGCYSFRIGVEKFPMVMELSDIRKRQSRRSPPRMFPSEDESQRDCNSSSRGKRGKNLWGVLRGKASLVAFLKFDQLRSFCGGGVARTFNS